MFQYIIFAIMMVCVTARPQQAPDSTQIPIVFQSDVNGLDGSYNYSYESGNGIKLQNAGYIKKVIIPHYEGDGRSATDTAQEEEVLVQVGSYSYPTNDGTIITLNYIADENGFQPQGEHLPTAPPIPDAILSSLQQVTQPQQQQAGQQPTQLR